MEHMVLIVGGLVGLAAVFSVLFKFVRQSSIIAFIVVGVLAGLFRDTIHIPHQVVEIFTEIGIILLLFMAGLEMEFESLIKRWKAVLTNGLGQILLNTLFGIILGAVLIGTDNVSALVFFGLCLTFSSTIVVLSHLKNRKEMESYHGQIILGLMVLQDITAVMALVVIKSMGGEGSLAVSLAIVLVKMLALMAALFLLAKFVLGSVFRYLAREKDLLFIGSLGWALGIAAFCEAFHFSPEIGAFMAGAALSFLPYKLEIQDKVEPMKDFGIILFFIALGYDLKLDASLATQLLPILAVTFLIVLGTPVLMLMIGFLSRGKSRPSFYTGAIINQISEFSLILATLCVQQGVFNDRIFLLITMATVATIFISSFGHQFIESIYRMLEARLDFMDRRSPAQLAGGHAALKDHAVIVKYNELAERFIRYYLDAGKDVLLVDLDPDVLIELKEKYRQQSFHVMYADIFDPDTRDDGNFSEAHIIVSCLVDGQEAELGLLNWLRENRDSFSVPLIASTNSRAEALELYEAGAAFVIQTEDLAAQHVSMILDRHGLDINRLKAHGVSHYDDLQKCRSELGFAFS